MVIFTSMYLNNPMVEFRVALDYGKSNEYIIEVWDGGRVVAVIRAEHYGLRISSRKIMHVDVSDDGKEIYITLPSVVE